MWKRRYRTRPLALQTALHWTCQVDRKRPGGDLNSRGFAATASLAAVIQANSSAAPYRSRRPGHFANNPRGELLARTLPD